MGQAVTREPRVTAEVACDQLGAGGGDGGGWLSSHEDGTELGWTGGLGLGHRTPFWPLQQNRSELGRWNYYRG